MNNGRNHLVFDLEFFKSYDNARLDLKSFSGMIAGSGIKFGDYRHTYDISLPVVGSFQITSSIQSE